MGVKFKYSESMYFKLLCNDATTIIRILLNISGIAVPEFYIVFYGVSLIYCGLAINKIKNIDKPNLNLSK